MELNHQKATETDHGAAAGVSLCGTCKLRAGWIDSCPHACRIPQVTCTHYEKETPDSGKMILKREGGIWGGKIYYTCKDFRHEGKSYSVYYVRNLNGDCPTLKVTRLDYWQPRTLADWVFVPVDVCGLLAVIRRYVPGVKILEINN